MKLKNFSFLMSVLFSMVILVGCNLPGLSGDGNGDIGEVPEGETTVLPTSTPTPFTLAPTLPPDDTEASEESGSDTAIEEDRAPTPLPEPTAIPAAGEDSEQAEDSEAPEGDEETEGAPTVEIDRSGIGIVMDPNLGEPTDVVLIVGFGFEPGEEVTLYWAPLEGERAEEDARIDADSNGEFERLVMIPPVDEWPDGPPEELDYIQMRAYAPSLAEQEFYFVNFRYVPRFGSVTGLVLEFVNPDYPYIVEAPNAWTWTWDIGDGDDPADNVRFEGPSGGSGFIRVFNTTNVDSVITAVMQQEFDTSYTTETATVGAYPATQAVTDAGNFVLFIPNDGFVYAVSFSNSSEQRIDSMLSSFRFTD